MSLGFLNILQHTHVSCVPKKNTWYLFEGDFTAPSGNSSIWKTREKLLVWWQIKIILRHKLNENEIVKW